MVRPDAGVDEAHPRYPVAQARQQAHGVRLSGVVGADGLRGELTLMRAARAYAALEGAKAVTRQHLIAIAPSALRHRLRRDVLDETGSTTRITRAIEELFG